MIDTRLRCYSFRQLSPYQGYYQIVETEDAQAVSRDGVSWQINVRTTIPVKQWGSFGESAQKRAVLFGFWEKERGLKRLPINPLARMDKVEMAVQPLLSQMVSLTLRLPFPPIDDYELWLLDHERRQPLVLVASSSAPPLVIPKTLRWHATATSDLSFIAPSLNADKVKDEGNPPQESHVYRDALERLIRDESAPDAQWYLRTGSGAGIAVDAQGKELENGHCLASAEFPQCLIRESWQQPADARLVADYIRWQAPWLLQLPQLETDTRERLEKLARQTADKVAQYHALYPCVVNQQEVNAALVEAVMKRAQSAEKPK